VSNITKQGFVSTVFGTDSLSSIQRYYKLGDKMKARLINYTSVFNGGFIFPKPDLAGNCDNFQSPSFMQNSNTNCNQRFNLLTQCLNLANPSIYTNELLVYTGLSAFFA
jgi:hypothetical protein